jgi:hypothetical protein
VSAIPVSLATLESLPRDELLVIAHDWMLSGMIVTRAMMPLVVLASGDMDLMNQMAIDEWMGASPVYTGRMKSLMGIEGDDVQAIMRALQLDVGFVHEYMDVAYKVIDDHHAEFWLAHCGALLDAEPHGEERVFGMCHTIEDPTFDATALATNPRARIRPIHRPPRVPADRHPHCHWTLTIDPANDPVGPHPLTQQVAALPIAAVPNERPSTRDDANGLADYRGPFAPGFRLADLGDATLVATAREFQMQSFLLMASSDLALRGHMGEETSASIMRDAWLGAGWIASERLMRIPPMRGLDPDDASTVAAALALTPMLPPGLARSIEVDGPTVRLELTETHPGVLDPSHAGWSGDLARGERAGLEGIIGGVTRRARVDGLDVSDRTATAWIVVDRSTDERAEPDVIAINRIGLVAGWTFSAA